MANHVTTEGPTIRVTRRDERSFFMSIIHFLLRCLRKFLNNSESKHEDGSIKLNPPKSKLKLCTLVERTVCDIHVYDIVPITKLAMNSSKRIYYFPGGGWHIPALGQHFEICAKMANEMPDAIVSIVSIPLAPNNPAPSSFPWCMKLYRALIAQAEEHGERVVLAGDSSGANVALSLVLEALREDAESGVNLQQVSHATAIMAICPSTDLTRKNPDIYKIALKDPLLTPNAIKSTAKAWSADWDPADRRISPINADILLLARKGIKVHGITAGCDVLSPDGIIFRDRCAKEGVSGEWVHWEKQMHCFVLCMPYGLSEAKEGVQWMIDVLRKE